MSIEEPIILPRQILHTQPQLFQDPRSHETIDILTGETYIEVFSPAEFKQLRQSSLAKSINEQMKHRAKETPIYFDPESTRYFYPIVALKESDDYLRPIIRENPPLKYNQELKLFVHLESQEPYDIFLSPGEFEVQRKKTPKETPEMVASSRVVAPPIYRDEDKFMFPILGLVRRIPKSVITGNCN